jgi:hypothetical protein
MKKITKVVEIEPLFNVGDLVMYKDNLLIVEIISIKVEKNRYQYQAKYLSDKLHDYKMWFDESELTTKPIDYTERLMIAYLDYKNKYETLIRNLVGKY